MQECLHDVEFQEGELMLWFVLITVVVLSACAVSQQEYKSDEAAEQYQIVREYLA